MGLEINYILSVHVSLNRCQNAIKGEIGASNFVFKVIIRVEQKLN